jgi:predicted transcriptional regulator of viral defense system
MQEVKDDFPAIAEQTVKNTLTRLASQFVITSVWQGFYVIVPVEYALRGVVPPEVYIGDLMKFLGRQYYVALLNAAAFYGAAHQRPQQLSVVCSFPSLRDARTEKTRINFIVTRKVIPQSWLKPFRTANDDIMVSLPELTASDLITFQKEIGGLDCACTVLIELAETLNFNNIDQTYIDYVPTVTVQRLGYLLENELDHSELADILYSKAIELGCKFQRKPLRADKPALDCEFNSKWKIIVNQKIETDEW